jgi:hypothetical protein
LAEPKFWKRFPRRRSSATLVAATACSAEQHMRLRLALRNNGLSRVCVIWPAHDLASDLQLWMQRATPQPGTPPPPMMAESPFAETHKRVSRHRSGTLISLPSSHQAGEWRLRHLHHLV